MCKSLNNLIFKGVGVFVFSDPAGAKATLAFIQNNSLNFKKFIVVSDRNYDFYSMFGIDVCITNENPFSLMSKYNPDFLFTGTSYTSKIELEYIQAAKKMKVNSYSFIDHWTSMKSRFMYDETYIFPDVILVIDEKARKILLNEAIDNTKVEIFDNPYYEYIKRWSPTLNRTDLYNQLSLSISKKTILFAPDPLSNVGGKSKFGFDEFELIEMLNHLAVNLSLKFNILVKLHPNQKNKKLLQVYTHLVFINDEISTNELIYHSDFVFGFFSNLLIEAKLLGKPVFRFIGDYTDPLIDSDLNIVFKEKSELMNYLNSIN